MHTHSPNIDVTLPMHARTVHVYSILCPYEVLCVRFGTMFGADVHLKACEYRVNTNGITVYKVGAADTNTMTYIHMYVHTYTHTHACCTSLSNVYSFTTA